MGLLEALPTGILVEKQIMQAANDKSIRLIQEFEPQNVKSCSYNLRVGIVYKGNKELDFNKNDTEQYVVIQPGEIITILTHETVNLPNCISATAFPVNSWSSKGFLVLNPGHIDPGYTGRLTMKAVNLTKNEMNIKFGVPIFRIIFEKLPSKTKSYRDGHKVLTDEDKKSDQFSTELKNSPGNIFLIPNYWKEKKIFAYTESDVHRIVSSNWMNRTSLIIVIVALAFSIFFTGYAIWKDSHVSSLNNQINKFEKIVKSSPDFVAKIQLQTERINNLENLINEKEKRLAEILKQINIIENKTEKKMLDSVNAAKDE